MKTEQWGAFKRLEKYEIEQATIVLSPWRQNDGAHLKDWYEIEPASIVLSPWRQNNGAHLKDWRSMRLNQLALYCDHEDRTMGRI